MSVKYYLSKVEENRLRKERMDFKDAKDKEKEVKERAERLKVIKKVNALDERNEIDAREIRESERSKNKYIRGFRKVKAFQEKLKTANRLRETKNLNDGLYAQNKNKKSDIKKDFWGK